VLAAALIGCFAIIQYAHGEDYPSRPISLIVPYPAGGGVDTVGRVIAQKLGERLGQQVLVVNRPGAGSVIGVRDAVRSAPDGYTLLMLVTGASLPANPGYDLQKDLTPPSPTLNYFGAEQFKSMTGTDVVVVTYKGTGPLTTDLLGGHIRLAFNTLPPAIGNIKAGNIKAIAVAAPQRLAAIPDVPTTAESGVPLDIVQYYGLAAPAGTPRPIIERLNKELRAVLSSEDIKQRIIGDGGGPAPSTPEEYAANIQREEGKWAALIKKLGLKVE
jgi:tripartite-type tricarboxylate transporter receptor subunit TctC